MQTRRQCRDQFSYQDLSVPGEFDRRERTLNTIFYNSENPGLQSGIQAQKQIAVNEHRAPAPRLCRTENFFPVHHKTVGGLIFKTHRGSAARVGSRRHRHGRVNAESRQRFSHCADKPVVECRHRRRPWMTHGQNQRYTKVHVPQYTGTARRPLEYGNIREAAELFIHLIWLLRVPEHDDRSRPSVHKQAGLTTSCFLDQ